MPNATSNLPPPNSPRAFDDGKWLKRSSYCPVCQRWVTADEAGHASIELPARLWIYTNYDCNLSCSYCLVSSNPWAERRGIGLERGSRLLDEAADLGITEVFFTGGEPFILPEIYPLIARATSRFKTTVLSNAMIIRGKRLQKLLDVNHPNLFIQVSLDDSEPGVHDLYRGAGSWKRALEGIRLLQQSGVQVRVATTVTPECLVRIPAVRAFVRDELGIADKHHIVRPLLKRGFAETGLDVARTDLVPEMTVDANGVYWHPVGTDADLLVSSELFPLRAAVERIAELSQTTETAGSQPFR
jgi:sulfatase maturation enzyme AslB (radical SAM superfamily)